MTIFQQQQLFKKSQSCLAWGLSTHNRTLWHLWPFPHLKPELHGAIRHQSSAELQPSWEPIVSFLRPCGWLQSRISDRVPLGSREGSMRYLDWGLRWWAWRLWSRGGTHRIGLKTWGARCLSTDWDTVCRYCARISTSLYLIWLDRSQDSSHACGTCWTCRSRMMYSLQFFTPWLFSQPLGRWLIDLFPCEAQLARFGWF